MGWSMVVHGIVLVYGGGGVLPGLVRLDLSIGGGLDGDDEEVVCVVSGCEMGDCFIFIQTGSDVQM